MSRQMKDSGIEWIGEIPADWATGRTKNCFSNHKIIAGEKAEEYERLALTLNGVIKRSKEDATGLQPEAFNGYQILRKGELVFKLIDLENVSTSRVGLSSYDGIVSPAYIVIEGREGCSTRFGEYFFLSMWQREVFNHMGDDGVRSSLNAGDLLNISYVYPNFSEQERIADYLDQQCAHIDAVIEKTKASIEEYKKLKQAVITEAVTKGVRGDRPMKDSELEWAGNIPQEWKISKISRIASTFSGATPLRSKESDFFENADIRWVRTLDLNDWLVEDSSEKITEDALNNASCSIMPVNTVCVAMYGGAGTIGKCGLLTKECTTNQAVCSIICDDKMLLPQFMLYELLALKKYWMLFAVGTRKDPNISQEIVGKMKVIIPSIDEQQEIIKYLNQKVAEVDELVRRKENFLKSLIEYKKSLIYEYITGKREVEYD